MRPATGSRCWRRKRSSRSAPSRNCLPPSIRGYRIISTDRAAAPRRRRTAAPRTTGNADGNTLEQSAGGRLRVLLPHCNRDLRRLDGEQIGRAPVCTHVTIAHVECPLLIVKKDLRQHYDK